MVQDSTNGVNMVEVEVWVLVDEDGDYAVGKDNESARESYDEDIGGGPRPMRMVRVKLSLPAPDAIVVKATLPPESSDKVSVSVS